MKTIKLTFTGFFTKEQLGKFPDKSGVYCIYLGTENCWGRYISSILLYIGKADSFKTRLTTSHNALEKCNKYLNDKKALLFNYAEVSGEDCERAEAALIYKHKPPVNDIATESFNYPDTKIEIFGVAELLNKSFIVP